MSGPLPGSPPEDSGDLPPEDRKFRLYVSSSAARDATLRHALEPLAAAGASVIYAADRRDGDMAPLDLAEVVDCDAFVLVAAGDAASGQSYIELGAALALAETTCRPDIFVVGSPSDAILAKEHPAITRVEKMDSLTNALFTHGASPDIDGIIASGWAHPSDFLPAQFAKAELFWRTRRVHDEFLLAARSKAMNLIREWTSCEPCDVGSLGLQLNLDTSDIDLGIGFPVSDRDSLMGRLEGRALFKGERKTRFSTTRLVYTFEVDGIDVDLSALTEEDFAVACRMIGEIGSSMTEGERIAHTWVKHQLRSSRRIDEYAAWKLVTYARYCPEFNWVPIHETV